MKIRISLRLNEVLSKEQANRVPIDLLDEEIEIVLYESISTDALIERIKTLL